MSHIARLAVDPENRIVMHNHASHLLAMSFTHELDEKSLLEHYGKCVPNV